MDLDKIKGDVIALCSKTAGYIREQSLSLKESDIEEKGKQNLVTYVDRSSEKMLVEGLSKILPGSGFIAEENTYERKGEAPTWIIDPLDGTTNFVHGLPVYSISIALMHEGAIKIGVVSDVTRNTTFHARAGAGAFLDDKNIRVSANAHLPSSLLVTGFPYDDMGRLDQYIDIFKELVRKARGVRRLGSAALDLCYVAAGYMDGFYEYGLNPWDVAAGALILEEAGGKVTDFHNGPGYLFGKELIATNGHIHNELREIINRHF